MGYYKYYLDIFDDTCFLAITALDDAENAIDETRRSSYPSYISSS